MPPDESAIHLQFEDAQHQASSTALTASASMRDALDANQAELIEQARQWAETIEVTSGAPTRPARALEFVRSG